jgi:hypothetical protein
MKAGQNFDELLAAWNARIPGSDERLFPAFMRNCAEWRPATCGGKSPATPSSQLLS